MNIKLYRIVGINKTDTPVFRSKIGQTNFFAALNSDDIETGFYPPFFRNSIKLDISDYNLTTSNWNYCSLEFNEKVYYYFITSKKYINENIIEITIELDTIQTYMFDATWIGSKVHRLSIPRWNQNHTINRDYVRENISENTFTDMEYYVEYNTSVDSMRNWTYITKFTSTPPSPGSTIDGTVSCEVQLSNFEETNVYTPYSYGFAMRQNQTIINTTSIVDTKDMIKNATIDNRVAGVYLVPFRAVEGLLVVSTGLVITDANYVYGGHPYVLYDKCIYNNTIVKEAINSYTISFVNRPFIPDGSLTVGGLFSPYKCPQLLDTNYVNLRFGDTECYSEYPLHELNTLSINCAFWSNITEGTRYYNLYITNYLDNEYLTITCNANPISLDLKNDAWKEYISRNKATLAGSMISSGLSGAAAVATGALFKGAIGGAAGLVTAAVGATNTAVKYFTNKANLEAAPQSIKSTGDVYSVIASRSYIISSRIKLCDDFEDCARFFETFGYRFDKYTPNALFGLNNRHLFDYVQTEYINIQLGDRAIEQDFEERFNNGLRLWHTDSFGVLNCKSGSYNTEMGDCAHYDNIEEWKYQELTA